MKEKPGQVSNKSIAMNWHAMGYLCVVCGYPRKCIGINTRRRATAATNTHTHTQNPLHLHYQQQKHINICKINILLWLPSILNR